MDTNLFGGPSQNNEYMGNGFQLPPLSNVSSGANQQESIPSFANLMDFGSEQKDAEIAAIEFDDELLNEFDELEEEQEYHFEDGIFPSLEDMIPSNRLVKFQLNPTSSEGVAWVDVYDRRKQLQGKNLLEKDKLLYPTKVPKNTITQAYGSFIEQMYIIELEMSEAKSQIMDRRTWELAAQEKLEVLIDYMNSYGNGSGEEITQEAIWDARNVAMCLSIVKFTPSDVHMFTGQFLRWVATVSLGWDVDDIQDVVQTVPPTRHPRFWALIRHIVLRGQDDVCAATLQSAIGKGDHIPADARECMEIAIQLFKAYPSDGQSRMSFKHWRDSALEARLKAREIEDQEYKLELTSMYNIMVGDLDTIAGYADSWYEALGAMLKYADPTRSRLLEYFQRLTEFKPVDTTVLWESASAAIISDDILTAIAKTESLDLGVANTLAQFCLQRGLLDHYLAVAPQYGQSITTWLSTAHAQRCLEAEDIKIVKLGIEMLRGVDTLEALECIAEVLPRIDWRSAEDIDWATNTASELGLDTAAAAIHKASAHKFFMHGFYYDAFMGLAAASDEQGLVSLCWKLFEEMLVNCKPPTDEVTSEALAENSETESHPLVRECMAPCAVLNSVLKSFNEGDTGKAAKNLVSLLRFPFLPPKYHALLIAMVIPLLSRERPRVFTSQQLIGIMTALNQWSQTSKDNEHESLSLLEHALALSPTNPGPYDWRGYFENGINGRTVLETARLSLAKEASRAFLNSS